MVRRSDGLLLLRLSPLPPFASGAREERPVVMHVLLHLPVGDENFCVGDEFTVYEVNGGMPLTFCISLLESVYEADAFR